MSKFSRCHNCTGELVFKPQTGMLVCQRCNSTFAVNEDIKRPVIRQYTPTYVPEVNKDLKTDYICTACGAKIVTGKEGEVKRCSSCGNTALKKEESPTYIPDGIIPFSISKQQAGEIFRKWVGSRKFAPSDLKQMARLDKLSGLYTPVWNFSFVSSLRYSCTGIKKRIDSNGDEEIREIDVRKNKDTKHADVLLSASSKISNVFIEGMGDYDFSKTRPYSTDYLLGFVGLETDKDIHASYNDVTEEISRKNLSKTKKNLDDEYDEVQGLMCQTRFRDVTFNYLYVPVFANHYTYKGKQYHCYINGQTGKASGNAPKSIAKIGGLILLGLGILAGIGLLIASIL